MNQLYLILLLFIITSCDIDKADFAFDPTDIPEQITDRISTLNLQNAEETILAVAYERTINVPSYNVADEEILLLTDKRFLRYYDFDDEGFIQEIEFRRCLDIGLDFDLSLDQVIFNIRARSVHDLFYNEKEERLTLIPDFNYVHYGVNNKYRSDLDSLNSLILQTWKSQNHYDSLQIIKRTFYDENGDWIVTDDRIVEKEKIQSLKNRLEEYPLDIIDSYGDLLVVRQDTLMRISYYFYDDQYRITTINADPLPTDELELAMVIDYYLSIQDSVDLPYTVKDEYVNTTYISALTSYVQEEEELIKEFFK